MSSCNKYFSVFSFCTALILYLPFCFSCGHTDDSTYNSKAPVSVTSYEVLQTIPEDSLSSFGTVSYHTKNDVTSQVNGTVTYIPIKEGDFVHKGTLIMQLQNVQLEIQKEQYTNALDSAKSALQLAQAQLREDKLAVESRLLSLEKDALSISQKELAYSLSKETLESKKELFEVGGITNTSLKQFELENRSLLTEIDMLKKGYEISCLGLRDEDLIANGIIPADTPEQKHAQIVALNTQSTVAKINAALSDVKNAEQSLHSVNILLSELFIKAPADGVIISKQYEVGDYVEENKTCASVMDISSVYAVFYMQEQDIVQYHLGTSLSLEIPSLSKSITATISEISPYADPQSGNFSIKVLLPNSSQKIKPGMFVKCKFEDDDKTSYSMFPESVLVKKEGSRGSLFCINNGIAVAKDVVIIAQKKGFIWVSDNLKSCKVIDKPSPFLKEGQFVEDHTL